METKTTTDLITVRANPKCKYCLGAGKAASMYGPEEHICSCVTEQLTIVTVDKDYSIPADQRYSPGSPSFEKRHTNIKGEEFTDEDLKRAGQDWG